jgi:hypothetical protein
MHKSRRHLSTQSERGRTRSVPAASMFTTPPDVLHRPSPGDARSVRGPPTGATDSACSRTVCRQVKPTGAAWQGADDGGTAAASIHCKHT